MKPTEREQRLVQVLIMVSILLMAISVKTIFGPNGVFSTLTLVVMMILLFIASIICIGKVTKPTERERRLVQVLIMVNALLLTVGGNTIFGPNDVVFVVTFGGMVILLFIALVIGWRKQ